MKPQPYEPILDACLEEFLAGQTPPDLSERVLRALESVRECGRPGTGRANAASPDRIATAGRPLHSDPPAFDGGSDPKPSPWGHPELLDDSIPAPPVYIRPVGGARDEGGQRSRWVMPSFWMACGAASILLVTTVVVLIAQGGWPEAPGVAEAGSEVGDAVEGAPDHGNRPAASDDPTANGTDRDRDTTGGSLDIESAFAQTPPFGGDGHQPGSQDQGAGHAPPATPKPAVELVRYVNAAIDWEIRRQHVMPAGLVDDVAWVERVYEVLLGRVAEPHEIETLTDRLAAGDDTPERTSQEIRAEWLSELFAHEDYRLQWARHWSRRLVQGWMGRAARDEPEHRRQVESYLTAQLAAGVGLDRMVYDLLTAEGSDARSREDFNPAASFLIAMSDEGQERVTETVARTLHGSRLDCVKCHQQPLLESLQQRDFWEFNAFFRQMRVDRDAEGSSRLIDVDFVGDAGQVEDAVVFFEDGQGIVQAAYPTFGDQQVTMDGRIDSVDRRHELATRLTASSRFRQTLVNRVWAYTFGVGMTRPLDDLSEKNPISHPELLAELADQLAAHDHRLESLLSWILLSEPFSRGSVGRWELAVDSPYIGRRPLFSRFYRHWTRPSLAADSLALVHSQRDRLDRFEPGITGILANQQSVPGGDADRQGDESVPLDLDLANAFKLRSSDNPWGLPPDYAACLDRIAASPLTLREKIEHLFLLGLSRTPTRGEMDQALSLASYGDADTLPGLQDVWWTLMISEEFDR